MNSITSNGDIFFIKTNYLNNEYITNKVPSRKMSCFSFSTKKKKLYMDKKNLLFIYYIILFSSRNKLKN
jgi:hypothetical protein